MQFSKAISAGLAVVAGLISVFAFYLDLSQSKVFFEETETLFIVVASASLATATAAVLLISRASRRDRSRLRKRRAFLIYSRDDLALAMRVSEVLKDENIEAWLDVEMLTPGTVWREEINEAMAESAIALVLVTKNSTDSAYVQRELRIAMANLESQDRRSSPIIPLLYEGGALPSDLGHIQYFDMRGENAETKLREIVPQAIDRVLPKTNKRG